MSRTWADFHPHPDDMPTKAEAEADMALIRQYPLRGWLSGRRRKVYRPWQDGTSQYIPRHRADLSDPWARGVDQSGPEPF